MVIVTKDLQQRNAAHGTDTRAWSPRFSTSHICNPELQGCHAQAGPLTPEWLVRLMSSTLGRTSRERLWQLVTRQLGRPWSSRNAAAEHLTLPQVPTQQQVSHCPQKLLSWQEGPRQSVAERDKPFRVSLGETPDSGDKPPASLPVPTSSSWRKVPGAPRPAPQVVPARAGSASASALPDRLLSSPQVPHWNTHPVRASTWGTASFSGAEQGACRHPTPARSNFHCQAAVLCSPQPHSHVGTAQPGTPAQPSWGRTGTQHS